MVIGQFDTSRKVMLVAEAGVNHEGDLTHAKRMVEKAAKAGADAIKFQTYKTEQLLMSREKERIAQRRKFELSNRQFRALAEHCKSWNIMFLSTPFDKESLEFLNDLVPAFKISSLDFNNYHLIKCALRTGKPLIMSCGMSNDTTIKGTLGFVREQTGQDFIKRSITLLHCVSSYPAPYEEINLMSIPYLAERYGLEVGYSDHAVGINMSLAAVALGARIVEKHFTLDKEMAGIRDHRLSADPEDLKRLVEGIRQIEAALGKKGKEIAPAEKDSLYLMRRGLVAAADLERGSVLTEENVKLLLPCEGIQGEKYFTVLGRLVKRTIKEGEPVRFDDIAWE
ncbi:MAG: N-acetylneuraminate synthase family protein [Candidatus Rokubacteria bacterium]|nr:N-acetylneuraminate synthase family protein [Candidatus Rokubacteria bacterium]